MILADFHTHSSNSADCDVQMNEQIESAISKGIRYLCITEHLDYDFPQPPKDSEDYGLVFSLDSERYFEEYKEMRDKYNSPDFSLYFGVEIGQQLHVAERNADFVKKYPFDFVLASSHLVDGCDPYHSDYYEGKTETEAYGRYFEYIYENICAFTDFDVYGHLDYIIRYGKNKDKNFSYKTYADTFDMILKKLIENGKGIEINAGGLRSGLKNPNPHPDILKRYKELGGEIITVGSDAHRPEHIAYRFSDLSDILVSCGFKYYTIFKNRKAEFLKL